MVCLIHLAICCFSVSVRWSKSSRLLLTGICCWFQLREGCLYYQVSWLPALEQDSYIWLWCLCNTSQIIGLPQAQRIHCFHSSTYSCVNWCSHGWYSMMLMTISQIVYCCTRWCLRSLVRGILRLSCLISKVSRRLELKLRLCSEVLTDFLASMMACLSFESFIARKCCFLRRARRHEILGIELRLQQHRYSLWCFSC